LAKFLVRAAYTAQGMSGLGKEGGTARAEVVRSLVENSGGRLEVLYFAFGEYDLYLVADLPDNVTAAALGIAVRSAGGVDAHVVALITPEEIDAAAQLPIMYQAPGR
jgi:uncharacterized protein with GYD domain